MAVRSECLDLMPAYRHETATNEQRVEYARCVSEIYQVQHTPDWGIALFSVAVLFIAICVSEYLDRR